MKQPSLAERRDALIAECSMQRSHVALEIAMLRAPSGEGFGIGKLKLPLMIAGVVMGMVAIRPGRALPLLTTGLSLFKMARGVLAMLRPPAP